jgi:hypothetical protein
MARELRTSAINRTTAVFLSRLTESSGTWDGRWRRVRQLHALVMQSPTHTHLPGSQTLQCGECPIRLAVPRCPAGWGHGATTTFPVPCPPERFANPACQGSSKSTDLLNANPTTRDQAAYGRAQRHTSSPRGVKKTAPLSLRPGLHNGWRVSCEPQPKTTQLLYSLVCSPQPPASRCSLGPGSSTRRACYARS